MIPEHDSHMTTHVSINVLAPHVKPTEFRLMFAAMTEDGMQNFQFKLGRNAQTYDLIERMERCAREAREALEP